MSDADDDKHWHQVNQLRLAGRNLEEQGLVDDVLCARCSRGTVFRRRGQLDVQAYCGLVERFVPTDIIECSDFRDPREMDMDDMNRLALKVDARKPEGGQYL